MESNTNMFKGDLDKKPKEKKPKQLTTDGGVVKEALKKKSKTTNDMDKVAFGAEVIVTYEGRIGGPDGAAFEKKENALLQLDKGQVLSGLEIAIKSMKKGEKARFTIKSEYGYGKDGNAELNVPADAVLSYVIELVSVVNQIWLTMDGGIRKKVLKEAPAADPMAGPQMTPPPDYEGTMHVHLIGRRSDGSEFQNTYKEGKEYTFVQGEGEAIIGLDKVVKSMKKGETCLLFLTAPYAFGEAGKPEWNIAPNSNVSYEVELVAYEKGRDHFWDTHSFEDKYSEALKRRELGNKYWEQGNIRCACKKYKKATKFLEYDSDFTAEEKEKSNALKIICFNNLAAAKVKTGKWHKVIQIASAVLQMDPNNVKALYRRAKGLNNIKEWDHARTDIKKALELDPNNVDVKRELVDINKRQKEYDSTDAKAMKKLLSEMAAEREEKERKEKQIAEEKQRIEDAKKRKAMMVYGGYGLVAILVLYILFTVFFRGSS